ncbi:MAG: hypothetical protein ABIE42_00655 [Candidatus Eisenbacteria bacterium]
MKAEMGRHPLYVVKVDGQEVAVYQPGITAAGSSLRAKVALRWLAGCITVEMEAAAFFAVAHFRGVTFAQMLYGGDDVSGEKWDRRDPHARGTWDGQESVRWRATWQ